MRMDRRAGLLSAGLPAKTTLDNTSWADIKIVSDAGQAANYWAIGDRKAVTLNGTVGELSLSSYSTYAFIIGFNHNSTYEGSNRIHFQFAKTALTGGTDICFVDSSYNSTGTSKAFRMNTSATNAGGWSSSYMRGTICGTSLSSYSGKFIGVLPSDLRTVLKSVTKYTDNTGNSSTATANVTSTTDYIFLLAEYEVFGSIIIANENESAKQAQYAYYSAGNSKVKYKHSDTSTACNWWLRSPASGGNGAFARLNATGDILVNNANYSFGFAPCFCV